MAQIYHNFITLTGGSLADRIKATQVALGYNLPTGNWDWIEVQIEARDVAEPNRRNAAVTWWDFYTRSFPESLDLLSQQFPDLTFHCVCLHLPDGAGYEFSIKTNENGVCEELDSRNVEDFFLPSQQTDGGQGTGTDVWVKPTPKYVPCGRGMWNLIRRFLMKTPALSLIDPK